MLLGWMVESRYLNTLRRRSIVSKCELGRAVVQGGNSDYKNSATLERGERSRRRGIRSDARGHPRYRHRHGEINWQQRQQRVFASRQSAQHAIAARPSPAAFRRGLPLIFSAVPSWQKQEFQRRYWLVGTSVRVRYRLRNLATSKSDLPITVPKAPPPFSPVLSFQESRRGASGMERRASPQRAFSPPRS